MFETSPFLEDAGTMNDRQVANASMHMDLMKKGFYAVETCTDSD